MKYKDFFKNENSSILENKRQAELYMTQGKLSDEDFIKLLDMDPTKKKKYVGWMAKQWIRQWKSNGEKRFSIDDLRNTIEEYDVFLNKGKVKTKDINVFKTFEDLASEVKELNDTGEGLSDADKENDYDTIVDNNNILVIRPHTHEASRKLGLTTFKYRDCGNGNKDSSWCTTYKTSDHWNNYYFKNNVTFYYFLIKSDVLMIKLESSFPRINDNTTCGKNMRVVALAVFPNGEIDGYDGLDKQIHQTSVDKFRKIVGV